MRKLSHPKGVINKVSLEQLFGRFHSAWALHLAGEFNGQQVKLLKFIGPFEWHRFAKEDALYYIFSGQLTLQMTKKNIEMAAGDAIIIPRGHRHRPVATEQVFLVIIQSKAANE